jgi:hypothetical protein
MPSWDSRHNGIVRKEVERTLMQSTRTAWLSASALLAVLLLASNLQVQAAPFASAATTVHVAQVMDPTLQTLATQAALEASRGRRHSHAKPHAADASD